MTTTIPRPVPTAEAAPFYEGVARGELLFQRCRDCGRFRHYPRPTCPACLSRAYSWEPSRGLGSIYTWTIVRGPTLPAFESKRPYNVVDVLLDEGVHFVSEVLGTAPDELRAGLRVRAVFEEVEPGLTLVKFRGAK